MPLNQSNFAIKVPLIRRKIRAISIVYGYIMLVSEFKPRIPTYQGLNY